MKQKTVTIRCYQCGAEEEVRAPSPAAPVISALTDVLRPRGWTYTVSALSMITGLYQPLCPRCSQQQYTSEDHEKTENDYR